jgi:Flp pilus assembly protein TadB
MFPSHKSNSGPQNTGQGPQLSEGLHVALSELLAVVWCSLLALFVLAVVWCSLLALFVLFSAVAQPAQTYAFCLHVRKPDDPSA